MTITDNDSVGVTISRTTLTIDEGGSDTYTVVLDTEPSAGVTVTISGHSGTDVSLDDTELTFATGNWDTAQTVTVTAEQDDDAMADADVTLTHAVTGASEYAAIDADDVPSVLVKITEGRQRWGDHLQDHADHRRGRFGDLHGGPDLGARGAGDGDRRGPRRHRREPGQYPAHLHHRQLVHSPDGDGDGGGGR